MQLLRLHRYEGIVCIYLCLLVHEMDTVLKKEVKKIAGFFVETTSQVCGQCHGGGFPFTNGFVNVFPALTWSSRPLFTLGISKRGPFRDFWDGAALAWRRKVKWICERHFFVPITSNSSLLDVWLRRVEHRVNPKDMNWAIKMAYKNEIA